MLINRRIGAGAVVGFAILLLLETGAVGTTLLAVAATPPSASITAPLSGTVTATWTGSVIAGVGNVPGVANLRCFPATNPTTDDFQLSVVLPGGTTAFYATHSASLVVRIDWQPVTNAAVNDLGLTTSLTDSTGTRTDIHNSHQQGTTFEQATILDPVDTATTVNAPSVYHLAACDDTNAQAQPYTGTATLTVGPKGGGVVFSNDTVTFAPATIVSPVFIGGEPQTTLERPLSNTIGGSIDPNRVFVDEPLSTRSQTGQIHRSIDGGDTFRTLLDLSCAPRQRPDCTTGGGGDTIQKVNLFDGTVFFADQEGVANESLASSVDHGDTFPIPRQFAASNAATGVDRQWIAPVNKAGYMAGPTPDVFELRAFLSYHIPAAGEYVQGVDTAGMPHPAVIVSIPMVSQSGISRFDSTGGPGDGYFYQSYRDGSGFQVAVVAAGQYQLPTNWKIHNVSTDQPSIFPWINLDTHGNLYATWVTAGALYFSASLIDDPANNPHATPTAGSPGTKWLPKVRINRPDLTSTVFPEIVAGDPGQVAVAYMGTADGSGMSDTVPATSKWNTYLAFMSNALSAGPPTVATAQVGHRVSHVGTICTSGTTCTGDRSLLDMIDLDIDKDGRVGVIFTDNNNQFARDEGAAVGATQLGDPFMHFAKLVYGESLFAAGRFINITIPSDTRPHPAGRATWPHTASGTDLPSLDTLGTTLTYDGTNVTGTIRLSNATISQMAANLGTFNTISSMPPSTQPSVSRLQWVLRFSTGTEVYFMSGDFATGGSALRFFGGRLNLGDAVVIAPTQSAHGAAYHADAAFPVNGSIDLATNTLNFSAPASQFGLAEGSNLYSVTAFSFAGPAEGIDTLLANPMRMLDGTPPFDTVLHQQVVIPEAPFAALIVLVGIAVLCGAWWLRRRTARQAQHP
jgi:hypothetical protein